MIAVAIAYTLAFALCVTILVGDRGFVYDLRSRSGRKLVIPGGRRRADATRG